MLWAVTATNLVTGTTATVEDPALTELVSHYDGLSIGPKSRVIGRITAPISRTANAADESALGGVIADDRICLPVHRGRGLKRAHRQKRRQWCDG